MNWAIWFILLCFPVTLLLLFAWLKFTEWVIEKQYQERQDDE